MLEHSWLHWILLEKKKWFLFFQSDLENSDEKLEIKNTLIIIYKHRIDWATKQSEKMVDACD